MDETNVSKEVSMDRPTDADSNHAPLDPSAEITQAYDSSTQAGKDSPELLPPSELAAEVNQPAPVRHKSLSFLKPSPHSGSLGSLGHFEVLELLGKGGFGIVVRAFDEKLHRMVAVKALAPQIAGNANARTRFVREARAAASVNSKHVVSTYEVYEQPVPYLVMEYIVGESLQERIDRLEPFSAAEILRIGAEIAEGLAAAHSQGLIHRDIKPANILLEVREGASSRVKIADFGLARAVDDVNATQSGIISGTPHYMSPEQARGETLDHRTDLFSLGSVLYTMCTSHPPFVAHKQIAVMKRVCDDKPRPICEFNKSIPDSLIAVVDKLLVKDADGRFQTAAEVCALLGSQLAQVGNSTRQAARKTQRRRWVAAAIALLALLCVTLTEATGVTHWFRSRPVEPNASGGEKPQILLREAEWVVGGKKGEYPVQSLVHPPRRALTLAERFPALARGEDAPKDNSERLLVAQLAADYQRYAFAACLWSEAFENDPKLGDDRQQQYRYSAAIAAILAAAGQSKNEPSLDDAAKAELRRKALEWLKAEQIACAKLVHSRSFTSLKDIQRLANWKKDKDLASIRDRAELAKLPPEERTAFDKLWADVSAIETQLQLQTAAPPLIREAAEQAWLSKYDELAATCERALLFAKDTKDPTAAERSAKICSIRQADPKTHEQALVLARRAVAIGKQHFYLAYFQMCLGMAEYRSGNYEEANAALLEAHKLATKDNRIILQTSAFYRAMSLYRLGKEDEARKLFIETAATMHPVPVVDEKKLKDTSPDDLIVWMSYKEALAHMFEALPPPKENK